MPPARTDAKIAMDMFRRMADAYDGPIMVQNAAAYAPLSTEQIVRLVDEIPQIEYIKEERPPGPRHIAEVSYRGWAQGQDHLWRLCRQVLAR
jgi:dihydrodipicolinate synthase/N-acetylneuraminate lyase